MGWIYSDLFWLFCPDFADVIIRYQTFECLEAAGVNIRVNEVVGMVAKLIMIIVIIPLNGRFLDRPVHALDLTIGPLVSNFG